MNIGGKREKSGFSNLIPDSPGISDFNISVFDVICNEDLKCTDVYELASTGIA